MPCLETQCYQTCNFDGIVYEVRFKRSSRYFLRPKSDSSADDARIQIGCYVNVEADRGQDVGLLESMTPLKDFVARSARTTAGAGRIQPDEKRILRASTEEEVHSLHEKIVQEKGVVKYIQDLCGLRNMPMTIADAEFQFDYSKLTVYYTATAYVVFKELVREVYKVYKTRIWLEQIGGQEIVKQDPHGSFVGTSSYRNDLNVDAPLLSREQSYSYADAFCPQGIAPPERAEEPGMAATAMAAGMAAEVFQVTPYAQTNVNLTNVVANVAPSAPTIEPKAEHAHGSFSPKFICPITRDVMIDPVICSDGYTYERAAIIAWMRRSNMSPLARIPLPNKNLRPDDALRIQIEKFREVRLEERLQRLLVIEE